MENTETDFYAALDSQEFVEFEGRIPFILGEKESGSISVKDLASLHHMVIAGATGTGKSTLTHSILLSMIQQSGPDALRLILCDTKMLEFQCYRQIPHLMAQVQTNLHNIESALLWANLEMEKRLSEFSSIECRTLERYNEIAENKGSEKVPYLVVVIDDAAIVMDNPPIKQSIDSLAHKGHLVGIHLILITQVPGLKQISDTITRFIPSRAVFNVLSNEEERLLLGVSKNEMVSDVGEIIFYDVPHGRREKIKCFNVLYEDVENICSSVKDMYPIFIDDYKAKKMDEAAAVVACNTDMPDSFSSPDESCEVPSRPLEDAAEDQPAEITVSEEESQNNDESVSQALDDLIEGNKEPRKSKKAIAAFLLLGASMIIAGTFLNFINAHIRLVLILLGIGIIMITILGKEI